MTLTLLFVSDESYLKYLYTILKSIHKNCINYNDYLNIHLALINIPKENIEKLKNKIENIVNCTINYTFINKKLSEKPSILDTYFSPNKKNMKSEKHNFCCNFRIKVINDLLKQEIPYIFYLDVDSIILKDLRNLFELIQQNDIIFHKILKKKLLPSQITKSGGIAIRNNNKTKLLFQEFHEILIKENYKIFGSDQHHLHILTNKYIKTHSLTWSNLPSIYLDWNFNNKSTIWTGKGKRKDFNQKYILKMKEFNL